MSQNKLLLRRNRKHLRQIVVPVGMSEFGVQKTGPYDFLRNHTRRLAISCLIRKEMIICRLAKFCTMTALERERKKQHIHAEITPSRYNKKKIHAISVVLFLYYTGLVMK